MNEFAKWIAESNPVAEGTCAVAKRHTAASEWGMPSALTCRFCDMRFPFEDYSTMNAQCFAHEKIKDPANHPPECLWRRANEEMER